MDYQQDHFSIPISYLTPARDSVQYMMKPRLLLIEFLKYLVFGTGILLAPIQQLSIFASSRYLDASGVPSATEKPEVDELPDIEIMPVRMSCFGSPYTSALTMTVCVDRNEVR